MTNPAPAGGVADRKRQLRTRMRAALAGLSPEARTRDSARLAARLPASPGWTAAGTVLGYVALPSEPDLGEALLALRRRGTTVALPKWDPGMGEYRPAVWAEGEPLVPGPFGVPEPGASSGPALDWERLDLVLVPGLAFDHRGRRLGRGRGFYDRLLARARNARRWGVAFDLQVVDAVPTEPPDINVHVLATPGLWLPVDPDGGP